MIKRIGLLIAVALMAVMMMAATAAPAFAQNAKECREGGGTFDASTKTCSYPVGNSGKVKTETSENAGQGDCVETTNPNGKVKPC